MPSFTITNPGKGDQEEVKSLIPAITKGVAASPNRPVTSVGIAPATTKLTRNLLEKGIDKEYYTQYDFEEFLIAEEVDGYIATTFRLTIEQGLKQGTTITGKDIELSGIIRQRLRLLCKMSGTTYYKLMEDLYTGLTKFNNAFIVLSRGPSNDPRFKEYELGGRKLNPINGMFYSEPQYLTPRKKNGKLVEWRYNNQELGSKELKLKPDDVIHFKWNTKNTEIFGTPWVLPALDDIRMLRRLEEFTQMLISKHLFPVYHYKVGTDSAEAIYFENGTSEVDSVRNQIGDLPQQGCVFTSHRHEITAISSDNVLEVDKYLEYFDNRALSSCGLSGVDIGRGDTSNKGTAKVMNQSRVDRCTRIQTVLGSEFDETLIFGLLLELGKNPFDDANEVNLRFPPIDTEERRAQEQHDVQLFQNGLLTHPEARERIGERPFTESTEWEQTYQNTVGRIMASQTHEASMEQEKLRNQNSQNTQPANQTNPNGKSKPKVSKNS